MGIFTPLFTLFQRSPIKSKLPFLLMITPVIAIRAISVKWGHHYGTAVGILGLFIFLNLDTNQLPIKKIVISVILIMFFDIRLMGGGVKAYLLNKGSFSDYCTFNSDRLSSVDKGVKYLLDNKKGKVLLYPNLTLPLAMRENIHMAGSWGPKDGIRVYDYLFIEKNRHGNPHPQTHEYYENLRTESLRSDQTEVIIDDKHVFLAKGRFKE